MKIVHREQLSSVFNYRRDDKITVSWALENLSDKQAEVLYLVDISFSGKENGLSCE